MEKRFKSQRGKKIIKFADVFDAFFEQSELAQTFRKEEAEMIINNPFEFLNMKMRDGEDCDVAILSFAKIHHKRDNFTDELHNRDTTYEFDETAMEDDYLEER